MARRFPIYKKRKNPYTNLWFFKVMYGDDHEKVMFLPPRFARIEKIEDNTDTEIKDSNGMSWPVTFSYIDGCLAFRKGWPEFFRDHNLKEGQFLIFKYRKSYFKVKIFGKKAFEKRNFDCGRARQKKRARREPEPEPEPEPAQTRDVNPKQVASESQFHNGQSQLPVANGASRKMPEPVLTKPSSAALEDPNCSVNRDDRLYRGEDRSFLFDLSSYEMVKKPSHDNKFEKAVEANMSVYDDVVMEPAEKIDNGLDTNMAVSDAEVMEPVNEQEKTAPSHTEVMENTDKGEKSLQEKIAPSQTKIMEKTGKFEESLQKITAPSHTEVMENTEKFEKSVQKKPAPSRTEIMENTENFEKSLEKKAAPSRTEIMENTEKFEKSLEKKAAPSNARTAEHVEKFVKALESNTTPSCTGNVERIGKFMNASETNIEPSHTENVEQTKRTATHANLTSGNEHMSNDFSIPHNGIHKVSARTSRAMRRRREPSVPKNPFGKLPMKKEQVELSDNANGLPKAPTGREPNMAGKFGQMHSPVVKTEPDLPDEVIIPQTAPFSVKVKSLSYLELPICIRSGRGRREKRVVYLRDPNGRMWPVHNEDIYSSKVLTTNWEQLCMENNINPGDECKFQAEDVANCIYKIVDVHKLG